MKWDAKTYVDQAIGTKYNLDFAWMPIKTIDNKWVWLEKFVACREFLRDSNKNRFYEWVIIGKWSQDSDLWRMIKYEYSEKLDLQNEVKSEIADVYSEKLDLQNEVKSKMADVIPLKDWFKLKNKNNL